MAETISDNYFAIQNNSKKTLQIFSVLSPGISSFTSDIIKLALYDGAFVDINFNTLMMKVGKDSHGFEIISLSADEIEALGSEYLISPPRVSEHLKMTIGSERVIVFRFPAEKPAKIKPASREAKSRIAVLIRGYEAAKRNKGRSYKSAYELEREEQMAKLYKYFSMRDEFAEAGINFSNNAEFMPAEENNDGIHEEENNGRAAGGAGAGAGAPAPVPVPAPAPVAAAAAPVSAEEASRLAAAVDMRRFISEGRLDNKRDRLLLLQVLGLQKLKANPGEIRKAYRDLSLLHHPDKGGNAEKFKNVDEAYSRLIGKTGGRRKTRKSAYRHRRRTYKH